MKHILSCLLLLSASSPLLAQNFTFQNVINPGDPAFDQLLGINNAGTIAGYFGDGTIVPNNGFTTVPPILPSLPRTFRGQCRLRSSASATPAKPSDSTSTAPGSTTASPISVALSRPSVIPTPPR